MQVKLSVVIITFNEEKNIGRCIESVREVADEIIVVDSFSTDITREICEKMGVRFLQHEFEGHIEQKNWASSQAQHSHILSLDADEALSLELSKSINEVKINWKFNGYQMNRLTNYCGKWVKHTGWYPDVKIRLFEKGAGVWGGINPHDKFIVKKHTKLCKLQGDILHYSYYSREEHMAQIEKFSSIGAKELHKRGTRSNYFKIFYKTLARFIKSFFIKKGFMDGMTGFTISRLSAYANYLKYSKLLKLQNGQKI